MSHFDSPCSDISLVISSSMLGLPEEIFLHVLSYLDTSAKLSAAQVCKTWRDKVNDWNLWKGVTAHLSLEQDMNEIVPVLEQRRISRVHISEKKSQEVELTQGVVDKEVDFRELCNLTRMMCDTLCHLDLTDLHVPNDKLHEALTPSMSKLTELMLSNRPHYNTTTYKTLANNCGKLERLVCCGFLMRDNDIVAMGMRMPNLHELDLSLGRHVTLFWFNNRSAMLLQCYMPKLTKLNLSACRINRTGLVSLSKLESLQELNLQSCFDLPDDCICILSEGKCGQQLSVLNISHCKMMNSEAVVASMLDYPLPLREFSITSHEWCKITDDGIQALLLESGKELESLALYGRTCITDIGFYMIANTCTKLKTFITSGKYQLATEGLNKLKRMASKPKVKYLVGRHYVDL